MTFPAYPEYKDSGVEWLGKVPAHWDVDRIKWSTFSCKNGLWGDDAQGDANDLPCVRVADFDRGRMRVVLNDPTIRNVSRSERAGRVLSKGDLVLEKSGGGEKQPVGFVVLYDDDRSAICSNFTARIQLAQGMNPSYWRYVHAAAYSIRLNVPSIKQTSGIQNLDQQSYLDERSVFPPKEEQQSIASFLDHEIARIDALIEEQRRLIELLKEKRQAVISHAVTKGLDPDVPMKDSGVEWLGEVPAHWVVAPLGLLLAKIQTGPFGSQLHSEEYVEGQTPVINPANIRNGEIVPDRTVTVDDKTLFRLSHQQLSLGEVVIGRRGEMGRCAVVRAGQQGWLCGTGCMKLICGQRIFPDYLGHYLGTPIVREFMEVSSVGSTMDNLNPEVLGNIRMPVPSLEEQCLISRTIDQRKQRVERLLLEASEGIALLQERRSALISAAVTGKIDVRDWQPPSSVTSPEVVSSEGATA